MCQTMLIRASCSKCLLSGLEVCQLLCRVLGTITVADRTIGTILCVLSFISYTNLMDLAVSVRYSDQAIGWYTNESGSSIAGKCLVIFFFLQIVQTGFDALPTSCSVGTGNFTWGCNQTTLLHAVTKLGI